MTKANIKTIVTETINFLATKYQTTPAEILKGLEAGHMALTNSFSALVKTGMEVAV